MRYPLFIFLSLLLPGKEFINGNKNNKNINNPFFQGSEEDKLLCRPAVFPAAVSPCTNRTYLLFFLSLLQKSESFPDYSFFHSSCSQYIIPPEQIRFLFHLLQSPFEGRPFHKLHLYTDGRSLLTLTGCYAGHASSAYL